MCREIDGKLKYCEQPIDSSSFSQRERDVIFHVNTRVCVCRNNRELLCKINAYRKLPPLQKLIIEFDSTSSCRATTPFKNCLAFSSWRSAQFPLGYCPTHVRPLRLTSLKRFLVAETSVVILFSLFPFSLSPSIALIFFINTFHAVRAWPRIPDRCFPLEYKRDGNHEGLYGDGIKAYSRRDERK